MVHLIAYKGDYATRTSGLLRCAGKIRQGGVTHGALTAGNVPKDGTSPAFWAFFAGSVLVFGTLLALRGVVSVGGGATAEFGFQRTRAAREGVCPAGMTASV